VSDKPKTTRRTGKTPVRRYFLTIVGALIVFGTFVFKEAFRDYLKDRADSVTAAETQFILEQEIGGVSEQLLGIERQLNSSNTTGEGRQSDDNYANDIQREIRMLEERELDLGITFDRISRLIEKFPSSSGWLQKSREDMGATLGTFHKHIERLKEQSKKEAEKAETLTMLRLCEVEVAAVEVPVAAYGGHVLEAAREQQDGLESLYRICTIASYILYTVGWALALFGRLYWIDGLVGGE
jgi:hypothetical protein